jgi:hypothetical protein
MFQSPSRVALVGLAIAPPYSSFATRRSSSSSSISLSIAHALLFSTTSSARFMVPSGLSGALDARIFTPPPFGTPPLSPRGSILSGSMRYSPLMKRATLTLYIISLPLILRCAAPNAPCRGCERES